MTRNSYVDENGLVDEPLRGSFVPHDPVDLCFDGVVSMCMAEFADEADINNIMRRYEKTGTIPVPSGVEPRYLDCTDLPSYQDAMNLLNAASEAFMSLPSRVRAEFENDPGRFVAFAEDPENLEQMRLWGLAPPAAPAAGEAPVEPVKAPEAPSEPEGRN